MCGCALAFLNISEEADSPELHIESCWVFQPSQLRDRDNKNSHVFVSAGGPLLYENVTFVYNSEQLNGTQRVLLDNVLSEEQCRELHSVASVRTASLMLSWPGLSLGVLWSWAYLKPGNRPEIPLSVGEGH